MYTVTDVNGDPPVKSPLTFQQFVGLCIRVAILQVETQHQRILQSPAVPLQIPLGIAWLPYPWFPEPDQREQWTRSPQLFVHISDSKVEAHWLVQRLLEPRDSRLTRNKTSGWWTYSTPSVLEARHSVSNAQTFLDVSQSDPAHYLSDRQTSEVLGPLSTPLVIGLSLSVQHTGLQRVCLGSFCSATSRNVVTFLCFFLDLGLKP